MPANPSSSESPENPDQAVEDVPMSRAERRAAARGKHGDRTEVPVWNSGKVHGARGQQQSRRQRGQQAAGSSPKGRHPGLLHSAHPAGLLGSDDQRGMIRSGQSGILSRNG
jgi:hypothetical protein